MAIFSLFRSSFVTRTGDVFAGPGGLSDSPVMGWRMLRFLAPMSSGAQLLEALSRLNLARAPVSAAVLAGPPADRRRIDRPLPAGCSYVKHASDGHAFYTPPADHENCPVGAFTHGVTLGSAKTEELQSLIGTMTELRYLRSDEIPDIPHRTRPMQFVAYAPLDRTRFPPDVIIIRGTARQIMLVSEAARAAGLFDHGMAMGRPACAMIPQALTRPSGITSLGCIGNRVYTQLGDSELYFAIPGSV